MNLRQLVLKLDLKKTIIIPCSNERNDVMDSPVDSGRIFLFRCGEEENRPQIALASKTFAPLICRVVRAMRAVRWRWALGLDSRLATPNLRFEEII